MRSAWTGAVALALLIAALAATPGVSVAAPSCDEGPDTDGKTIHGTPCSDTIHVPNGVNRVYGEGGDDRIYAGRGNARLYGGDGDDRLYGGPGDDRLRGGDGDDLLSGGFGADSLDGEDGSDMVRGDATIDYLFDDGDDSGDEDTLTYATAVTPGFTGHRDFLSDYDGFPDEGRGVFLDLNEGHPLDADEGVGDNGSARAGGGFDEVEGADFEIVVGSPFADVIVGTRGEETIYGGGGADIIVGAPRSDLEQGNGGAADEIHGGYGIERVVGEAAEEEGGEGEEPGEEEGEPEEGEEPDPRPTDSCRAAAGSTIDCATEEMAVEPRDPESVVYGTAGPGAAGSGDAVYLAGSDGDDDVVAEWDDGDDAVVLTVNGAEEEPLELDDPPDSLLLAGLDGDDRLVATDFPDSTSVVLLGGSGEDELRGGDGEDVLVGGDGDDTVRGGDGDDALTNNAGADDIDGGDDDDLFISSVVCEGDDLDGGSDRDNAQWAQYGGSVSVDLGDGEAGGIGSGGDPDCDSGSKTALDNFEDLEGSNNRDFLRGDSGNNVILGRLGADSFLAEDGNDVILANSGDSDRLIDCGDGTDRAIIDRRPKYDDPDPIDCESVWENDPNSFEPPDTPPNTEPPDTTAPETTVERGPAARTLSRKAVRRVAFVLGADEPARYICRIDRRQPRRCATVARFYVARGEHVLRAWAIDGAGNRDMSPATHEFRLIQLIVRSSRTHRRPARTRRGSRPPAAPGQPPR